jgi:hypothetical protein
MGGNIPLRHVLEKIQGQRLAQLRRQLIHAAAYVAPHLTLEHCVFQRHMDRTRRRIAPSICVADGLAIASVPLAGFVHTHAVVIEEPGQPGFDIGDLMGVDG